MRLTGSASILLAALAAGAPIVLAEEIYRHVDKEGHVTYSDQPSDGGKAVRLGHTNTIPESAAPRAAASAATATTPGPAAPGHGYALVSITEPADGSTLARPSGTFDVSYTLQPALQPGDTVQLLMDGQPSGTGAGGTITVLAALRGEHSLLIEVLDSSGKPVGQSAEVRFLLVRPEPTKAARGANPG